MQQNSDCTTLMSKTRSKHKFNLMLEVGPKDDVDHDKPITAVDSMHSFHRTAPIRLDSSDDFLSISCFAQFEDLVYVEPESVPVG